MRTALSLFLLLAVCAGVPAQTSLVNGWKKTYHDPGVRISPWPVTRVPARARERGSVAWRLNIGQK